MGRDGFVFYRNIWEQLLEFEDKEELLLFLTAMCDYGFYYKEPEFKSATQRVLWLGIKDKLDYAIEHYNRKCKRKKEAKKEKTYTDTDTFTETETVTDTDTEKNENDFFEKKKEKFRLEVFSFKNYPRHHLQTFFDYYASPQKKDAHYMVFEKIEAWNLRLQLAKWKAPAEPHNPQPVMVKTREQCAESRKADEAAERQRIEQMVEEYRSNPTAASTNNYLVLTWQKNGLLKKLGIDL